MKRLFVFVLVMSIVALPVQAEFQWDDGLKFQSNDKFSLELGAILQPRFEYENKVSNGDQHNSFSLQRGRVGLKGHAYTKHLRYRILMELANNTNLLDGWVEYRRFDPYLIRMGQFVVPFNRERDLPVTKLLGTSRSIVNSEFQWPTGRDAGLMLSRRRTGQLEYRLGLFGGEGRNNSRSRSDGILLSGRTTYEIIGNYERKQSFVEPLKGTNLSVGSGGLYATDNTATNWFSENGGFDSDRSDTANLIAATVDFQWRSGLYNFSGSYVHREIEHDPGTVTRFDSNGYSLEGGYILSPGSLFLTARHALVDPNNDQSNNRQRTWELGLHLFQKGNRAQTRFQTGIQQIEDNPGWDDNAYLRVQQQLFF